VKTTKELIRTVPDYPKPGIQYRDITTLLKSAEGFRESVEQIANWCSQFELDLIAGIDARGFIFGSAVAFKLNLGFVPVRKEGKLPHRTIAESYELEYGTDCLEVHEDAIEKGAKVVIVDDLLATGGTAKAAHQLLQRCGAEIKGLGFLVELTGLHGREILENLDNKVFSAIRFDD
jgi:adenine phosphoribosyltransferase|tara:strand:- start:611 stop:1138 length:528 start_codon:yes stop_codon:yes gene_type:complete